MLEGRGKDDLCKEEGVLHGNYTGLLQRKAQREVSDDCPFIASRLAQCVWEKGWTEANKSLVTWLAHNKPHGSKKNPQKGSANLNFRRKLNGTSLTQ